MTSVLPFLTDALDKKYNDIRTGVHVSDISLCPRQSVYRRLNPAKTTPKELNFFTLGKSLHQAQQDLTEVHGDRFAMESEVWLSAKTGELIPSIKADKENDITAHIDIYDQKNNIPVECKGIRKASIEQPYTFHVQQLKYYMAMTGAEKGIILYQLIMHFKDKPFKEFLITLDEVQRAAEKQKLLREAKAFARAVKAKDPMLAHGIIKDEDLNWKCDDCPLIKQCQAEGAK